MTLLAVRQLNSLAELRSVASPWNELWQRADAPRPTSRAEQLAIWVESFADERSFRAIIVEHQGQFVAALPLVRRHRYGLPTECSLGNSWTTGGELLVDRTSRPGAVCMQLLHGIASNLPGLLSLDGMVLDSPGCRGLLEAFDIARLPRVTRRRFEAPHVRISGTWDDYLATRTRNFRRHLKTIGRRSEELGDVKLLRYESPDILKVEPLVRRCLELEARGWKGRRASAVLNNTAATTFFLRQSGELARCGQLAIAVLQCAGRPIAFEYGWRSHGVRGVLKIGYDEEFARLSPGQLLRGLLLEQLFAERQPQWVDFIGPSSRATRQWATHQYSVGKTLASTGSPMGDAVVTAYRLARQFKRLLLRQYAGRENSPGSLPVWPAEPVNREPRDPVALGLVSDLDNPAEQF